MKKRAVTIAFSLLSALILFQTGCSHEIEIANIPRAVDEEEPSGEDETTLVNDEKIYWQGSIEDDFDGSSNMQYINSIIT